MSAFSQKRTCLVGKRSELVASGKPAPKCAAMRATRTTFQRSRDPKSCYIPRDKWLCARHPDDNDLSARSVGRVFRKKSGVSS
jgi:hypothetical protein